MHSAHMWQSLLSFVSKPLAEPTSRDVLGAVCNDTTSVGKLSEFYFWEALNRREPSRAPS
jgi:hypothetical protein